MHQKVQQRINNTNQAYFSVVRLYTSKLLSGELKVKLYIAYIKTYLNIRKKSIKNIWLILQYEIRQ